MTLYTGTLSRGQTWIRGLAHSAAVLMSPNRERTFRAVDGTQLALPVQSKTARRIAMGMEPISHAFVRQVIKADDVVIDVGANRGYMTLATSNAVGPYGKVYAFEPHKQEAGALQANLIRNRVCNVNIIHKGIADRIGSATLNVERDGSRNHLSHENMPASANFLPIQVTTLDQFLGRDGMQRVRMVNLDIEGAELLALEGATQTLSARQAPMLMLTLDDAATARYGGSGAKLYDKLASFGYSVFEMSQHVGPSKRVSLSYAQRRASYTEVQVVAAKENGGRSVLC